MFNQFVQLIVLFFNSKLSTDSADPANTQRGTLVFWFAERYWNQKLTFSLRKNFPGELKTNLKK